MQLPYQVVVSSENTVYMAWQTQLFCYSCLSRLEQAPIVIVHETGEPLLEELQVLRSHGCRVVEAASCGIHPTGCYAPRNELGSLLVASALEDLQHKSILFCEPDMIFVRPPVLPMKLCAEFYSYLQYQEERVSRVINAFGLKDGVNRLNSGYRVGVPYHILLSDIRRIAVRWFKVLDSFSEISWIDIMYAFGIALLSEGRTVETTHIMQHNQDPKKRVSRDLIHYCYGDARWNKKMFLRNSPLRMTEGSYPIYDHTEIGGEIIAQLREAKAFFYSAPNPFLYDTYPKHHRSS